ncbi:MAG: hypothetical protein K2H72_01610 [Muribaculaceae bacterium]|nr:hypothetical protein [Muribaculaceae bacterium]
MKSIYIYINNTLPLLVAAAQGSDLVLIAVDSDKRYLTPDMKEIPDHRHIEAKDLTE